MWAEYIVHKNIDIFLKVRTVSSSEFFNYKHKSDIHFLPKRLTTTEWKLQNYIFLNTSRTTWCSLLLICYISTLRFQKSFSLKNTLFAKLRLGLNLNFQSLCCKSLSLLSGKVFKKLRLSKCFWLFHLE